MNTVLHTVVKVSSTFTCPICQKSFGIDEIVHSDLVKKLRLDDLNGTIDRIEKMLRHAIEVDHFCLFSPPRPEVSPT